MFSKNFFDTPLGINQLIAYELYVTYGLYQREIAEYLNCSNNTVANYVRKISNYKHLNNFKLVVIAKNDHIQEALQIINSRKLNTR